MICSTVYDDARESGSALCHSETFSMPRVHSRSAAKIRPYHQIDFVVRVQSSIVFACFCALVSVFV